MSDNPTRWIQCRHHGFGIGKCMDEATRIFINSIPDRVKEYKTSFTDRNGEVKYLITIVTHDDTIYTWSWNGTDTCACYAAETVRRSDLLEFL